MITKSKARGAGGLTRHLERADTNELVVLGQSRDLTPKLNLAMEELAMRGATAKGRKNLFHVVANPEPGEYVDEQQWDGYWKIFESEFELTHQPFVEVRHRKKQRDHRHRVYSLVRDDGRLVAVSHNFRRNELVSRLSELQMSHQIHQGRHQRWVVGKLKQRGMHLPYMPLAAAKPGRFRQAEHQQADRRQGAADPANFKSAVYKLFVESRDDWRQFASRLDAANMTVARGHSSILVVDETSTYRLPLARVLREEAKRHGQTRKITTAELELVFGRAKPLAEELEASRERQKVAIKEKPTFVVKELVLSDSQLSQQMTLLRRSSMIANNSCDEHQAGWRRKLAMKRAWLERCVPPFADVACLPSLAYLIRCVHEGHVGLASTKLLIREVAATECLSPALLAAAAVRRCRHMQRAMGVDEPMHLMFRPGDILVHEQQHYASLAKSSLFASGGLPPGEVIVNIGVAKAVAFLVWWSTASQKQQDAIGGTARRTLGSQGQRHAAQPIDNHKRQRADSDGSRGSVATKRLPRGGIRPLHNLGR